MSFRRAPGSLVLVAAASLLSPGPEALVAPGGRFRGLGGPGATGTPLDFRSFSGSVPGFLTMSTVRACAQGTPLPLDDATPYTPKQIFVLKKVVKDLPEKAEAFEEVLATRDKSVIRAFECPCAEGRTLVL